MKKIKNSPKYYEHYPLLFHKYFNKIEKETVDLLSKAGYSYYNSILFLDELIDDKKFSNLFTALSLQEETIKILSSIYGLDSPFWDLWQLRKKEYFQAIQIEKTLSKDNFTFEKYEDLADKKSAFGKIAIDSLYSLYDKNDTINYETLLLSHKYFSVGFQLYDDVTDFKEDFNKNQFNIAVYELGKVIDFEKYNNCVETLNKLLFIKGVGQKILKKSSMYFEKSEDVLQKLNIKSLWGETIFQMKQTLKGYLDTTNGYLYVLQTKINLSKQEQNKKYFFEYNHISDSVIKKGIDFIKSDFANNYADLKHIMYLSNLEGFENKNNIHISDIFQRALIDDCLYSVSLKYNIDISSYFNDEFHYFIENRTSDDIGAWSYFPSVNEIACDIDDLAQIIQFFVNSNNKNVVNSLCKKAIDISLKERYLANGGIETWIIPQKKQTEKQKKQEFFNTTKWGKGPDVEVVANFIYALSLLNDNNYSILIQNTLRYIVEQQDSKGFWQSRWYYGNFYGTYVCLRVLKMYKNDYHYFIEKALTYIKEKQNFDGGFSLDESNNISDPLSSALALLSLKLFYKDTEPFIQKTISYLHNSQDEKGGWRAINFIKPKVYEPYKSYTLTTAYVLKSLCS